jgi:long-chain acyl-CoA synthetase
VQTNDKKIVHRFNLILESMQSNGKFMYAGALLERAVTLYPNRCALICKNIPITYAHLYYRVETLRKQLEAQGVAPGERVCVWIENSIEFYVAYYAAWHIGAVVVPLNTFLIDKELLHIIKDAKPKVLFVSRSLFERIKGVDISLLPHCIFDDEIDMQSLIPADFQGRPVYQLEADTLSVLLYTSGTTGFPKGVMLSSRNILTNVAQVNSQVEVSSSDRLYGLLPLFHSFAQNTCVWSTFFVGATTIIIPKIDRHWIFEGLEHKPTVIAGVPALYGLLCLMKTASLSSVRYFICGGDALPDKIRSGFELLYRRKICNGYGLTEASPFISAYLDDELVQTNTIGKPAPAVACSLRDELGNEVERGQVGSLWVKGDNVMLGYYNDQEQTRQVIQDGWLNTGDLATFDYEGRLIIAGREKDLIIHKGFNIYPQEIENVLLSHPEVFKAAVVGFNDPDVGEVPIAFLAVRTELSDIQKQVRLLCKENLAPYKVPRQFILLKDLPMTALGKIDKKKLRAEYAEKI